VKLTNLSPGFEFDFEFVETFIFENSLWVTKGKQILLHPQLGS
jgi:hypothetical protein